MGRFTTTRRTQLSSNGTEYIYIENTDSQKIAVDKIRSSSEGQVEINIYQGTGQDSEGTDLNLVDKDGRNDFIDAKVEYGGSYTTNTPELEFFVPGGSTGTRQGSTQEENLRVFTINSGENYLFEINELSGSETEMSFNLHITEI